MRYLFAFCIKSVTTNTSMGAQTWKIYIHQIAMGIEQIKTCETCLYKFAVGGTAVG